MAGHQQLCTTPKANIQIKPVGYRTYVLARRIHYLEGIVSPTQKHFAKVQLQTVNLAVAAQRYYRESA